MATVPHESALRKITIVSFLPAFPLLIASGVKASDADGWVYYRSHQNFGLVVIYFGLIPIFFSAVTSIIWVHLEEKRKEEGGSKTGGSKTRAAIWLVFDFLLTIGYLAVLIPVWIIEPRRMNAHADWMMLETYATCFLIVNAAIHAYLFFCHANQITQWFSQPSSCPHCVHCHQQHVNAQAPRKNREGYTLLPGIEEDGEGSTAEGRLSQEV